MPPSRDRISHAPGSLLFLCNGHGEDLITLRIIQAVHRRAPRRPLTGFLWWVPDGCLMLQFSRDG